MKVLVLGGNDMFGSMVANILTQNSAYHVEQTLRQGAACHSGFTDVSFFRCDVLSTDALWDVFLRVKSDCIVNCTGLIDRSLNSDVLRKKLGYTPPSWHDLVEILQSTRPKFNS